MKDLGVEWEDPSRFSDDEGAAAKAYWSHLETLDFYTAPTHWSHDIADRVLSYRPKRVLEFGCNAGRNLQAIDERAGSVELVGLDINEDAVAHGVELFGLDLRVADESGLEVFENNSFDVSFTISVLDHLPHPQVALTELIRVSRLAVILLEPELGVEGRVVANRHPEEEEATPATPYSYSWDYEPMIRAVAPEASLTIHPHPLRGTRWGPFYRRFEIDLR